MKNAGWRLSACIASCCMLAAPTYAGTTIAPGETLETHPVIGPEIDNYDFIDNQGTLNNSNRITNHSESRLDNSGVINNSMYGSIYFNSGQQHNNTVFNNSNLLNNSGAVIANGVYTRLDNSGTIVNTGGIVDFHTTTTSGVIDNYGTIEANNFYHSFNITSTGVLNNIYTSSMPPIPPGQMAVDPTVIIQGVLTNDGVINNADEGYIEVSSGGDSRLVNNGVINNGDGTNNHAPTPQLRADQIENNGEINNRVNIEASSITSTGTILNEGTISASSFTVDGGTLAGSGQIIMWDSYPDTGTLVITEHGTLAPMSTTDRYGSEGEFTGQMMIDGDVLLDGAFAVDFFGYGYGGDQNYDSLHINGDLVLGETAFLDLNFNELFEDYIYFEDLSGLELITADSITGEFSNNFFFYDGNHYAWEIVNGSTLVFDVAEVPVPASIWLFMTGLMSLATFRRTRPEKAG